MRFPGALIAATLAMFMLFPAAQAADMADSAIEKAVDVGFSDLERQMVEKYFGKMPVDAKVDTSAEADDDSEGGKNKGVPPGLAKRDSLPPGLAKRETLPPGLAQRALPADLEEQLPPPPEGYERQIVGDTAVVLVEKATGKVADIIKDILIPSDYD